MKRASLPTVNRQTAAAEYRDGDVAGHLCIRRGDDGERVATWCLINMRSRSKIRCAMVAAMVALASSAACSDMEGVGDENDDSGAASGPGDASVAQGPFDLHLELTAAWESGVQRSAFWHVVVRDMTDGELVAYARPDVGQQQLTLNLAGVLLPGAPYLVAINSESRVMCAPSAPTVYVEDIAPVTDDVSLKLHLVDGQGNDGRACDWLFEPVDLPAGLYRNADTLPGLNVNQIELEVSESGRVYRRSVIVLCDGPPDCYPSMTTTGPTCSTEITPDPGVIELSVGGIGSSTRLSGTATINAEAGQFEYEGTTTTWTSSSFTTKCCEQSVSVPLVRVADDQGCP